MPDRVLRISQDVVHRRVGDEVVVVHLVTNEVHALNDTAGRLWELLAEGLDGPALEKALSDEYDVAPDVLSAEIDVTLARLEEAGLVVDAT